MAFGGGGVAIRQLEVTITRWGGNHLARMVAPAAAVTPPPANDRQRLSCSLECMLTLAPASNQKV